MSHDHEHLCRDGYLNPATADRPAPGKRALTDRLAQRPAGHSTPAASLRGRERAIASFDLAGDYREERATIDGPPRDPLDFLDDDRRQRERPRHRRRRGGHGGDRGPGGERARGGDHDHPRDGGAAGSAAARKLLGSISNRAPLVDGEAGAGLRTRLVVLVGRAHGVTDDTTFQLCHPDGRPDGAAALVPLERARITTALGSRFADETIPADARVLVTIPAAREPELHPDGSIGDDDGSRLEA
jgi:hypothetical protein